MHTVRDYVPLELIGFFRREAQYRVFGSHAGETSSEHVPTPHAGETSSEHVPTPHAGETSSEHVPALATLARPPTSFQLLVSETRNSGSASRRKKLANA